MNELITLSKTYTEILERDGRLLVTKQGVEECGNGIPKGEVIGNPVSIEGTEIGKIFKNGRKKFKKNRNQPTAYCNGIR